jgi:membrane-associated phospholipid phosphatase
LDPVPAALDPDTDAARRPDAALALVAAVFCVALAGLALTVGAGPLPIDLSIRDALHVGDPIPILLQGLNLAGGALVWDAGVAVLIVALVAIHRRIDAFWVAAGLFAGEALATALKLIVDRPRPPGIAVVDLVTQASFPSGHVTRTAVTLGVLVLMFASGRSRRIVASLVALAFVLAMGIARIESSEHWPTDVLGSLLLAGIVICGVAIGRDWLTSRGLGRRRLGTGDPSGVARSP